MGSKAIANSTLVLRMATLLILAASVVVMATNTIKADDDSKFTFKDIIAYRFVIATAMAGFVYSAIQMPFAMCHACSDKRLIRNGCLPEFDFYADKIMSFLLAAGAGAGFAVSFEFKRLVNEFLDSIEALSGGDDEISSKINAFFNRANIATAILLVGFVSMAVHSVLSSTARAQYYASQSKGPIAKARGYF